MATETYRYALTTTFKNWHNLAVGALLLAFNGLLVASALSFINTSQTALQGWATLIIAGYVFVAAVYLASSPLSGKNTLAETAPGIFDHFKAFIVGGVLYAAGFFLLRMQTPTLGDPGQMLPQVLALIVGGALLLLAVLMGVAAAFSRKSK